MQIDKFITPSTFNVNGKELKYYSLEEVAKKVNRDIKKLPYSLKILLENLLRNFDGVDIKEQDIINIFDSVKDKNARTEILFAPSRVLMQDFTGVPAVVDLAAMRDAVKKMGNDPKKINPLIPVDLVIDHSVQVDHSATDDSLERNMEIEMERNIERYKFLKWAQKSFNNFRVVPPGVGICHQVNLEHLATVVHENNGYAYPDTVVGTDSHTTMINGLGVLGWGVGGIEAEAAMLGQPISMLIPEVIGFKLTGKLRDEITATDLVLTITNILRKRGVVEKFVEFFGPSLFHLTLSDRATIANMAPEYGATCGIFPVDLETIGYLRTTGRSNEVIELVEKYFEAQKLFYNPNNETEYSDIIELDLSTIETSVAGPKRPQDKIHLDQISESFKNLKTDLNLISPDSGDYLEEFQGAMKDGNIAIAAITSCTNTSNPYVMVAAGIVAKKAVELGLKINKFTKTSLAPGSQVVSHYLTESGLQEYLDKLGFNVVGFGCTTCIGNSGPLHEKIEEQIKKHNLTVASVLSGNRNFEGRIHPLVKANYLASPPLVVAYALAGNVNFDIKKDSFGVDKNGKQVYFKDIWPTKEEINNIVETFVNRKVYQERYKSVFIGNKNWQDIEVEKSDTYDWEEYSTYIRLPNYFDNLNKIRLGDVVDARIVGIFGDSITTDHISPAGNIGKNSPAAKYLNEYGVEYKDFNSYGARRGNHEVMVRGTFANVRIKNEITTGLEGGFTKLHNSEEVISIYDASKYYLDNNVPLVVFAGKEYGTGSSRDWAAKGTMLLGIKAVIAESFERIHRSNLVGMGVLPLVFTDGQNRKSLNITNKERINIFFDMNKLVPSENIKAIIEYANGDKKDVILKSGLVTYNEIEYYKKGGILQFVINQLI